MPAKTDNAVVIAAPLDLVWDMTNDIESWPELFSEYAKAEVLERKDNTVTFRLTTRKPVRSWVSQRVLDRTAGVVQARRLDSPSGPFEYMRLRWEYVKVDGGVKLRWQQEFQLRARIPFVHGWVARMINRQSVAEMARIKGIVERAAAVGAARV
jgi:aromatase